MVQSYMKPFIIFLFSFPLSTCFPLFLPYFSTNSFLPCTSVGHLRHSGSGGL